MDRKLKLQSIESPDAKAVPGEGKPRRHSIMAGRELIGPPKGINNLYDNLLKGASKSKGRPFLGHRMFKNGVAGPYVWQTYAQVIKRVDALGSGLIRTSVKPLDSVGIFSVNRPEWLIAEQACLKHRIITVPLYDTLGSAAIEYIVAQTRLAVIFATTDKATKLLTMHEKLPSLRHIIIMDVVVDEMTVLELRRKAGDHIQVSMLVEVERCGQSGGLVRTDPAGLDDVSTIIYTSGTSGMPKGVVLTHGNMLAHAEAFIELSRHGKVFKLTAKDVHLSYLPLAHGFERFMVVFLMSCGGQIGFYQGDTNRLLEDMAELKPTLFISVPRLFNRIYDQVWADVAAKGPAAAALFNTAFRQKRRAGAKRHWLWDRLVFGAVRKMLGGRVRHIISGSAPIAPEVLDFLRVCFSANVYEGYGQTECTAGLAVSMHGDRQSGHVGAPFPCCEVKLVDLPAMHYTSADKPYPRGEICVRGSQVFREYYQLPDKTAEAIDAHGWLHTGDVGMWDEFGRLKVIDRAKAIFKLAQGEYIAPERIENVYQTHPLVTQAFVYGDSLQAALIGVIVPDVDELRKLGAFLGLAGQSVAALCRHKEVRQHIVRELDRFGRKNDLRGFEIVKNIRLEAIPFSLANDLLTPTFKLKRQRVQVYYKDAIKEMYAELSKSA